LRLVLATANPDKAEEIRHILESAGHIELLVRPPELDDVEETGETLLDNARLKARALVEATGVAAIADDTGLEVEGLDGAPGVYSARFAGPGATYRDNVDKLLAELATRPDAGGERRARFRTVALVAFPDGTEEWAEGVVDGRIAQDPRGESGFGYDPVFIPDEGDGRTFAQMDAAEKHAISHRGRAFRSVGERLARRKDR
jgi:XTP/dITP diphosphohydrolase